MFYDIKIIRINIKNLISETSKVTSNIKNKKSVIYISRYIYVVHLNKALFTI